MNIDRLPRWVEIPLGIVLAIVWYLSVPVALWIIIQIVLGFFTITFTPE